MSANCNSQETNNLDPYEFSIISLDHVGVSYPISRPGPSHCRGSCLAQRTSMNRAGSRRPWPVGRWGMLEAMLEEMPSSWKLTKIHVLWCFMIVLCQSWTMIYWAPGCEKAAYCMVWSSEVASHVYIYIYTVDYDYIVCIWYIKYLWYMCTYIIKELEWNKAIYSIGSFAAHWHWCPKMPPNHLGVLPLNVLWFGLVPFWRKTFSWVSIAALHITSVPTWGRPEERGAAMQTERVFQSTL